MTVQDIMDRVSTLYNDTSFDRVGQTMYLKFLDDALNQLVLARPDAHVRTTTIQLDPGTRQTFPEDAIVILDIYRNRGQDGVTDGPPIWQVNRKDLDYFSNWHAPTAVQPTYIDEFAYDGKVPRTYWISPASGSTTPIFIEMSYSYAFPQYALLAWETALTQTIPCDEVFKGPICAYMLYLLYATDSSSKYDKDVAEKYKNDFYTALGLELKAGTVSIPTPGDVVVAQAAAAGGK